MEAAEDGLEFAPVEQEQSTSLVEKFQITEDKINELADKYLPLKISGVADKFGYGVVHAGRMEMVGFRLAVDKTRKNLNDKAQTWIKTVNAEAKRLAGLMAPIEAHLDAEESAYDLEIEKIKAEKQKAADELLQNRISALQAVGAPFQVSELVQMRGDAFDFLLATATDAWKAKEALRIENEAKVKAYEEQQAKAAAEAKEAERIEKERADQAAAEQLERTRKEQAAEAARLAAVKAEQDAQTANLKAQQDKIDADRRAIEQAQRDEQIRKDAEAKAKADAERKAAEEIARKEREAAETTARAEAEAKRQATIEAAKPDAEKLAKLAGTVDALVMPDMTTEAGQAVAMEIKAAAVKFAAYIRAKAEGLTK